jgi:hypothetical protein
VRSVALTTAEPLQHGFSADPRLTPEQFQGWALRNETLRPPSSSGIKALAIPKVVVMVAVVAIVGLLILMPLSRMLAKRETT